MNGRKIAVTLVKRGWALSEIAHEAEISISHLQAIIDGREKCDEGIAENLSSLLHQSVRHQREEDWSDSEREYGAAGMYEVDDD